MHAFILHVSVDICVFAGMWCVAWETQQGFCSVALQSDGGGSAGGQAVITNSIHFRNNNTALRVNRRLFSSGSHRSAQAKNSFTVISCYITGWSSGLASNWIAYLLICTLHTRTLLPEHMHNFSESLRVSVQLVNLRLEKNNVETELLEYIEVKTKYNCINVFFSLFTFYTCISSVLFQVSKIHL